MMKYVFNLIRGDRTNSEVLELISLYVPDNYIRARHHNLFDMTRFRTAIAEQAPLSRALRLLNDMTCHTPELDIFYCSKGDFHRTTTDYLEKH